MKVARQEPMGEPCRISLSCRSRQVYPFWVEPDCGLGLRAVSVSVCVCVCLFVCLFVLFEDKQPAQALCLRGLGFRVQTPGPHRFPGSTKVSMSDGGTDAHAQTSGSIYQCMHICRYVC